MKRNGRLVEFDAVENHHLAVDDGGVAQVDITVAFADETVGLALAEQRLEALEAGLGPGLQGIELQQVGLVLQEGANLFEVLPDRLHDRFRSALVVFLGYLRGVLVEMRDLLGHLIDVPGAQFAVGLQCAE